MNKIQRYAAIAVLIAWGMLSFCVLCAEDAPNRPMSETMFYASKAAALASLYACNRFYRYLVKKGIITNE